MYYPSLVLHYQTSSYIRQARRGVERGVAPVDEDLIQIAVDFVFVRRDSAYLMLAGSALAAPDVDFVFVRRDSAYFMQAWSALAAPDVDCGC